MCPLGAGRMPQYKNIKVDYSVIDGAHFFSGRDVISFGLCVAHKDLKTAFDSTLAALKLLIVKNHGLHNVTVEPTLPYAEFAEWAKAVHEPPAPIKAKKPAVSEVSFALEAA
jgi:hypothetical protein